MTLSFVVNSGETFGISGTNAGESLSTRIDGGSPAWIIRDYIHGGGGSDTIVSDLANDISTTFNDDIVGATIKSDFKDLGAHLYGEDGNDVLAGDERGDYLDGGSGNDTIGGSGGDDTIVDTDGRNVIDGGTGFDTAILGGDQAGTTLSNVEKLQLNGFVEIDLDLLNQFSTVYTTYEHGYIFFNTSGTVLPRFDSDTEYEFYLADGGTTLDVSYSTADVLVDGFVADNGLQTITTGSGNDTIQFMSGAVNLKAGAGDDTFEVQGASGSLDGGTGDNVVEANYDCTGLRATNVHTLVAGYSLTADAEFYNSFSEITYGSEQPRVILTLSGSGAVHLAIAAGAKGDFFGGNGDDSIGLESANASWTVDAGDGNDTVWGGSASDYLMGGDGADTLAGGVGNDTISGGAGADTAVYSGAFANFHITGNVDGTYSVVDMVGNEGTDTVDGIEHLKFSDLTYDFNHAPTAISLSGQTVAENVAAGTVVGTLSGSDADAGDALTFALDDDANGTFAIVDGKLVVADGVEIDFETTNSYAISVTVTDAGGLTHSQDFTIGVADINEAPTAISLSGQTVAENAAAGTVVGTLTGGDPDTGDALTFTLDDDANGTFAILNGNLVVADGAEIDFETSDTFIVSILATDAGGLTHSQDFTIGVADINEAPTAISLSGQTVAENAAAGTVVGTLTGGDPDAGDAPTFTLDDDANGTFAILNGKLVVADGAEIDFETTNSYAISVTATDAGGLTHSQDFTIGVTDINEAPTAISLSGQTVAENAAAGTVVGILTDSDPDVDDALTFVLDDDANGTFAIADGKLVVANDAALDFETSDTYIVSILATDAGGLTHSQDFTIGVADINEAPTAISLSGQTVAENAAAGTVVGTLTGSDPDTDDALTFVLDDDANGTFAIADGKLVVAAGAEIDFETTNSYAVSVTVTDAGGLTHSQDFTIGVTDEDEAIRGNAKNNTLHGGSDDDVIRGLGGNDTLDGEAGADELDGGNGIDSASYESAGGGVVVNLSRPAKNTGDADGDSYTSIENLIGSKFNDKLTGNNKENELDGGKGDDILTGGANADLFILAEKYGTDTITDFDFRGSNHDIIDLSDAAGIKNYKDLIQHHIEESGDDLLIAADDGSVLILAGAVSKDLAKADFLF